MECLGQETYPCKNTRVKAVLARAENLPHVVKVRLHELNLIRHLPETEPSSAALPTTQALATCISLLKRKYRSCKLLKKTTRECNLQMVM